MYYKIASNETNYVIIMIIIIVVNEKIRRRKRRRSSRRRRRRKAINKLSISIDNKSNTIEIKE